jgi:hypothetical protein
LIARVIWAALWGFVVNLDGVTWWLVVEFAVAAAAVLLGVAMLLSIGKRE